jgi:rhodanese-related sulfurtransferase
MGIFSRLFGPKADFGELINERKAQIIDVRSSGEFRSGHLKNSKNIPLDSLKSKTASIKKDRPVVVCCASGTRSGMAKGMLKSMGYEVYNGGSWSSLRKHTH